MLDKQLDGQSGVLTSKLSQARCATVMQEKCCLLQADHSAQTASNRRVPGLGLGQACRGHRRLVLRAASLRRLFAAGTFDSLGLCQVSTGGL